MKPKNITLHDHSTIPQLGFGLWQVPDAEAQRVCLEAFRVGYRSIDSAQIYQNEMGLGRAMEACGLAREELYITTKIWNSEHGFDSTLRSFEASLEKLKTTYVDLLLIHWPAAHKNLYVETWKALIQLKLEGRARAIGVSNFTEENLDRIITETGITPVINQVELHPYFQQRSLRDFHRKHQIQTECWSPLGQGQVLKDPTIAKLAQKYQKSPAQIIIRWHLDQDLVVIPKSVTPGRIRENFEVQDFKLSPEDLKLIDQLHRDEGRIGPDPATATF